MPTPIPTSVRNFASMHTQFFFFFYWYTSLNNKKNGYVTRRDSHCVAKFVSFFSEIINREYHFIINKPVQIPSSFFGDGVTIDPSAVSGVVKAVIVINQGGFFVVHLGGPLDGLDEVSRGSRLSIGRVGEFPCRFLRRLVVADIVVAVTVGGGGNSGHHSLRCGRPAWFLAEKQFHHIQILLDANQSTLLFNFFRNYAE